MTTAQDLLDSIVAGRTLVLGEIDLGSSRSLQIVTICANSWHSHAGVVSASCADWTSEPHILHFGSQRFGLTSDPFTLGSAAFTVLSHLVSQSPALQSWAPGKTAGWTLVGGTQDAQTRPPEACVSLNHLVAFNLALSVSLRRVPEWRDATGAWPEILQSLLAGVGDHYEEALQLRDQTTGL